MTRVKISRAVNIPNWLLARVMKEFYVFSDDDEKYSNRYLSQIYVNSWDADNNKEIIMQKGTWILKFTRGYETREQFLLDQWTAKNRDRGSSRNTVEAVFLGGFWWRMRLTGLLMSFTFW